MLAMSHIQKIATQLQIETQKVEATVETAPAHEAEDAAVSI